MKKTGNNLGRLGPRGFKSRSMQAWQEAYERGEAEHAVAPLGYREALKRGELKKKDVPYMVRGGSWDNSDVAGAKRKRWLPADREYTRGLLLYPSEPADETTRVTYEGLHMSTKTK